VILYYIKFEMDTSIPPCSKSRCYSLLSSLYLILQETLFLVGNLSFHPCRCEPQAKPRSVLITNISLVRGDCLPKARCAVVGTLRAPSSQRHVISPSPNSMPGTSPIHITFAFEPSMWYICHRVTIIFHLQYFLWSASSCG